MDKEIGDKIRNLGKDYKVVLLDLNNIGMASLYQPNLSRLSIQTQDSEGNSQKMLTGSIMGSVATIGSIISQLPNSLFVGLWDGRADWRRELCPEYKSNRRADPNSEDPKIRDKAEMQRQFKLQQPYISRFLTSLGVVQLRAHDAEADDFAGLIAHNLKIGGEHRGLLCSSDTDWLQSLSASVDWFRSTTPQKYICWEDVQDPSVGLEVDKVNFGSSPDLYKRIKAMAGDSSDEIPGVVGVGLGTALKFVQKYGDFEDAWLKVDSGEIVPSGKKEESMCTPEARRIFRRNLEVMDFEQSRFSDLNQRLALTRIAPCESEFLDLCEQFEFTRLHSQFKKYEANHKASDAFYQSHFESLLMPREDPCAEGLIKMPDVRHIHAEFSVGAI